jgi:uncharacterized protein YukJ
MPASRTIISSFPTSTGDGASPDGQLFMASNGDLLGATVLGGANGIGTTYEIVKTGGSFATTPTFLADIPSGLTPLVNVPNLSADANGDLFGLEITGGANSLGAVVEFPKTGGSALLPTIFASGTGASHPGGKLLVDSSGNLFGTTLSGGVNNAGTVFEIQKTGNTYATSPTILTSFASGIVPSGSGNLVEDSAGDLFGTTTSSVFEVQKTGANSYANPVSLVPFPVGTQIGSLTLDAEGDIFGTTISSAPNDDGSVFEIDKTATGYAGTATTLASFTPADGQLNLNHPKALIVDANGDLFGTTDPSTQTGGNAGGVVYEIVKTSIGYDSTPDIVVNFQGSTTEVLGANLVADANGDLFGTTRVGSGANLDGTAFEITGSGFVTTPSPLPPPRAPSDFTGNGTSDVLLQNGGTVVDWLMNNGVYQSGNVLTTAATGWDVVGTGDFTGNGISDPLLQNGGTVVDWIMNNGAYQSGNVLTTAAAGWDVVGTGDFTGNGTDDVLLQNGGSVVDWIMNNGVYQSGNVLTTAVAGWNVVGTGDFTGTGTSDVVLQNGGTVVDWIMNNGAYQSGNVLTTGAAGWKVVGTGDFSGNGTDDVLLQNGGTVVDWVMQNGKYVSGNVLSTNAAGFNVVGTGDYNGDGTSDILLQNGGTVVDWIMKDGQYASGNVLTTAASGWHVAHT